VRVEVQTSSQTKKGDYRVNLIAATSGSNEEISVSQERDINFRIRVLNGKIEEDAKEEKKETKNDVFQPIEENKSTLQKEVYEKSKGINNETRIQENKTGNPLTGKIVGTISTTLKNRNIIILFGIIFTILGSLVIYKYA